jgi:hypothetical protein
MITDKLLEFVLWLQRGLVGVFPDLSFVDFYPDYDISGLITSLSYAFIFFPFSLFKFFLQNVIFWLGVQAAWAIIEWMYRKIPGVD